MIGRKHLLLAAALACGGAALAQPAQTPAPPAGPPADREPVVSVTRHSGVFGGQRISYTATAGETFLRAEDGTARAAIFSVAYVREPRDPNRPVTFLFNGGPGSGSVWLHMGAFGPRRVAIPSDGTDDGAPPFPIVDNPDSLLDVTDIVFIDPVGTGFSHALGTTPPADFYGVTKDAQSIAQFIRLWLNENGRWNSPKYLGGESYGTTRSAAVLNQLEGAYNDVALNGVILISTVLDFGAGADTPGNEMTHILNLPSMAATALYHGKAQAPLGRGVRRGGAALGDGPLCSCAAAGQRARRGRTGVGAARARPLHRPFRSLSRAGRPARHAVALLQGAAARPRPHHRPARRALYRPRL